jgi:acetyl-CoA carboxylase carboxyl transferase subunit alpha
LWKDVRKAPQAAVALKIISHDLKNLGIIDQILPEPIGGAHSDPLQAATTLKQTLLDNLDQLNRLTGSERRQLRYQKFRSIGVFTEIAH